MGLWRFLPLLAALPDVVRSFDSTCTLQPLGDGLDDTDQIEEAILECGTNGNIVLEEGTYNVTRKMQWDLQSSQVDLHGVLSFVPDISYWLDADNTYRVVFIQNQASWFVVSGSDFLIDAHGTGGIQGNGQPWWDYFQEHTRRDGDGRPIAFTVWQAENAIVKDFGIQSPPFWCNTVAESKNVTYDGMICNATNGNPEWSGENAVPNTDGELLIGAGRTVTKEPCSGINTYRSSEIVLANWDVSCGDDCLAIKGNTSDMLATNITCRGGNGIAFGSLGQYFNLTDIVENVVLDGVTYIRPPSDVQPNMKNGLYLKSWTGRVRGDPPTSGGGGTGYVRNITAQNFVLDELDLGVHLYQTNGGSSSDTPSQLMFSDLHFVNWTGTLKSNNAVNFACSSAVGCDKITFENFDIETPGTPSYSCSNVSNLTGLASACD